MARCYHCGKVLNDSWVRKEGASLLGRAGGQAKARTSEQARAAANARWGSDEPKKDKFDYPGKKLLHGTTQYGHKKLQADADEYNRKKARNRAAKKKRLT